MPMHLSLFTTFYPNIFEKSTPLLPPPPSKFSSYSLSPPPLTTSTSLLAPPPHLSLVSSPLALPPPPCPSSSHLLPPPSPSPKHVVANDSIGVVLFVVTRLPRALAWLLTQS